MDNPFEALREIAHACFKNSRDHGWHEETKVGPYLRALLAEAEKKIGVPPDILDTLRAFAKQMERDKDAPIMVKLALIGSEVGEAVEAYRDKHQDPAGTYYRQGPELVLATDEDHADETFWRRYKPEGLGSELADIVIRVFDLAGLVGIDIAAEIERKMKYNESRPYRHGGKLA